MSPAGNCGVHFGVEPSPALVQPLAAFSEFSASYAPTQGAFGNNLAGLFAPSFSTTPTQEKDPMSMYFMVLIALGLYGMAALRKRAAR